MKILYILILLIFGLSLFSCSSSKVSNTSSVTFDSTQSGLKFVDLTLGNGKSPIEGSKCTVHLLITDENGSEIENTFRSNRPVVFTIGKSDVIKGLEEGVLTMKQGGKRKLLVPPELGFGARALKNVPGNAYLFILTELIKVE